MLVAVRPDAHDVLQACSRFRVGDQKPISQLIEGPAAAAWNHRRVFRAHRARRNDVISLDHGVDQFSRVRETINAADFPRRIPASPELPLALILFQLKRCRCIFPRYFPSQTSSRVRHPTYPSLRPRKKSVCDIYTPVHCLVSPRPSPPPPPCSEIGRPHSGSSPSPSPRPPPAIEEDRDCRPPPPPPPGPSLLLRAVDPRAVEKPLAAVDTLPSPAEKRMLRSVVRMPIGCWDLRGRGV